MMSESTPGRGFTPGTDILGVKEPPTFTDAADVLIDSKELQPPSLEPVSYTHLTLPTTLQV